MDNTDKNHILSSTVLPYTVLDNVARKGGDDGKIVRWRYLV